jgi:hypothetical protein
MAAGKTQLQKSSGGRTMADVTMTDMAVGHDRLSSLCRCFTQASEERKTSLTLLHRTGRRGPSHHTVLLRVGRASKASARTSVGC